MDNKWNDNWTSTSYEFKKACDVEYNKFIEDLNRPTETQDRILKNLINIGRDSVFGITHKMNAVATLDNYRASIPIRSYDQLLPWIDQETQSHGGVLTSSPVARWLKTSGTTGVSKKIPYTHHWMSEYRVPAMKVMWATYAKHCPDIFLHPYAVMDMQSVREEPCELINGKAYQSISNRHPPIDERDWMPPWYDAPWFSPTISRKYDDKMYYRLRYFLGQDLRTITSINPSTLISIKSHLLKNLPELIDDIRKGELRGCKITHPNPGLANSLTAFLDNQDVNLKDIWPNLSLVTCWTSASAKMYLGQINKLFPNVKILPFMGCSTEGVITLPIDDHPVSGPLAINQAIYEFIPTNVSVEKILNQSISSDTLLFNELHINREYYLIISQANGLYRLFTGDIFKVIDYYHGVPRIEFIRREGAFHSFTGEKLTESQIIMAMSEASKQCGYNHELFVCSPVWGNPPYYKILVELNVNHQHADVVNDFSKKIDRALCQINCEYQSKRETGRLGAIDISIVSEGSINRYIEIIKSKTNSIQYKYKPLQVNDELMNEILNTHSKVQYVL